MKTFYANSIHTLLVVFTFILLASSCSKKSDPDPLDQYVGNWSEVSLNGQNVGTSKLTIRKSGKTLTLTDFMPYGSATASVSGSGFKADNPTIDTGIPQVFLDNSQGQVYLQNLAGSLSGGNLTLTYTIFAASATMSYRKDAMHVYVKK